MKIAKKISTLNSKKNIFYFFIALILVILQMSCATQKQNTKVQQQISNKIKANQVASKRPNTSIGVVKKKTDYQKQFATISVSNLNQQIKKTEGVRFSDSLTLLSQKKYSQSLDAINALIKEYPKSEKMPKYLFLKTRIFSELRLSKQAFQTYQKLSKNYPNAHETKMAIGWIQ